MKTLNIEIIGANGPDLLLLHGWGQSIKQTRPLGELLARYFKVHLVDLPGFGESEAPKEVWNSFQYAEILLRYLEDNQISRCHIAGHSFGGKVALSFAACYPSAVQQLILIGSAGLKRKRSLREQLRFKSITYSGKFLKLTDSILKTELFSTYFAPKFGSADYRNSSPIMRAILVKSVNEDLTEHLFKIEAPTLLLWGENDQETPLEVGRRFKAAIKNSQLVIFKDKGHYLYQDCGAHLCAAHMLRFLRQ